MQHSSDSTCSPPGKQTNKPLAPQQHLTPPHPEHRCSATPQGPPTKHRMAFKSTAGVSAGSPTAAAHIARSGYGARNVPYVSKQLQQTCWPQKSLQIVHARCTRHLCCKLRHNTRLHTTCTCTAHTDSTRTLQQASTLQTWLQQSLSHTAYILHKHTLQCIPSAERHWQAF